MASREELENDLVELLLSIHLDNRIEHWSQTKKTWLEGMMAKYAIREITGGNN